MKGHFGLIACFLATAAIADGEEPETLRAADLPPTIRALHAPCAASADLVSFARDATGKAALFFVSCPKEAATSWPAEIALRFDPKILAETPVAIYLARDRKGRGAVRLTFPVLTPERTEDTIATLPANAVADYEEGDRGSPWIIALWKPDRSGMCKIRARWKVTAGKSELRKWEEAPKCTAKEGPVYETILDRSAPLLRHERD
jgi:hypothetical protein